MTRIAAVRHSAPSFGNESLRLCKSDACLEAFARFMEDAECPAFIGDEAGRFIEANSSFCELLGASRDHVIGSMLRDWFPGVVADERLRFRERVLSTGRAARATDMLRGRRFTSLLRPFEGGGHRRCVIGVLHPRPPRPDEAAAGLSVFEHVDLGPLAALTPKEMEVLQLIGQGLTQRAIADRLNRTVKTVEAHRAAIGRKLGAKKNVHLVRVAMAAGLIDGGRAVSPGAAVA